MRIETHFQIKVNIVFSSVFDAEITTIFYLKSELKQNFLRRQQICGMPKGVKNVRYVIHHRIWKQAKQNLAEYFAFSMTGGSP